MPPASAGALLATYSIGGLRMGELAESVSGAQPVSGPPTAPEFQAPKGSRTPASGGALNLYARIDGKSFPVLAVKLSDVGRQFLRKVVTQTKYARPRSNYQVSTYETIPR
jgi:hypothetical protein